MKRKGTLTSTSKTNLHDVFIPGKEANDIMKRSNIEHTRLILVVHRTQYSDVFLV